MKGSELKEQVRGLCPGPGDPLTQTSDRTAGLRPCGEPGRQGCPAGLRGPGSWVVCQSSVGLSSFLKPNFLTYDNTARPLVVDWGGIYGWNL